MLKSGFLSIVAVMLGGTIAHALECEPFSVKTGDKRVVEYVDNGTEGLSAGDLRLGYRNLVDEEGSEVGSIRWVATVVIQPTPDSPTEMFVEYIFDLNDGHINFHHLLQNSGPPTDTSAPSFMTAQPAVVAGGTGHFKGADGSVFITREENAVRYNIEIECD